MNRQQARNLLLLADKLERVKPKLFDMRNWAFKKPECGTTCCALGYACSLPFAKEAGVYLKFTGPLANVEIRGKEYTDSEAIAKKLFGTTPSEFNNLFLERNPNDPKEKAEQIRGVVGDYFPLKVTYAV